MNSLTILAILTAFGWGYFTGMYGKVSIRKRYGRTESRRSKASPRGICRRQPPAGLN